ncbi:MAG: cytochrome c biogenesis protein CcsA [Syntrophales bacterium]|jgi:cytochrome c-type biogenesis protein CcsB
MHVFLFKLTLAAYLLSTFGYLTSLVVRRVLAARVSTWIFAAAFLLHTASFGARCIEASHSPVTNLFEALSFFTWVLAGGYLFLQFRTKTRVLGAFISPATLIILIAASAGIGGPVALPSVLKSGLVSVHVILAVAGEALFALASFAGAMYLIQDGLIRRKKASELSRLLPSLGDLDRINYLCMLWGFPLLTIGVLVGAVWARTAWGSVWQWDPKQIWTLMAWILYAILLHQRVAIGWKGRKAAMCSLLFFILLAIAFAVEAAFIPTIHRFM